MGKTIQLFLIDDGVNGRIKAQIQNWTGLVYKIPRDRLKECKDLEPFHQSGVYILFGKEYAYVGQAEVRQNGMGIHQRLLEHENDKLKNLWDEVVMFTTKDNTLGKTEISYLEHHFYNRMKKYGQYILKNSNVPQQGTITEEKRSELEEYVEKSELVLNILGFKAFKPELDNTCKETKRKTNSCVPALPKDSVKIGSFILTAMKNLESSGYVFSVDQMKTLLDIKECNKKELFNLSNKKVAFFKIYDPEEVKPHVIDGVQRYYSPNKVILHFGNYQVLLTKEWFEKYHHRDLFIKWYNSL